MKKLLLIFLAFTVTTLPDYHLQVGESICYEKISQFKEVSVDYETQIGVYEADALKDGVVETVRIEKDLCICSSPRIKCF